MSFLFILKTILFLPQRNLRYFYDTLPILTAKGLIPGFLRYEVVNGRRYLVDIVEPQLIYLSPNVMIENCRFIGPVSPYWAGFILDKNLATEYIRTDPLI